MTPFIARFKWRVGSPMALVLGFTDHGDAIIVDEDGDILTTDESLTVDVVPSDWPLEFIGQLIKPVVEEVG